jgi:PLP dependent protein
VSKTHPVEAIEKLYALGVRDFGENKVQELSQKAPLLPPDTRWHMIGHLQRNKVKQVLPLVHLIHSVDSPRLYKELLKESEKQQKEVGILFQIHIAQEDSKYGFAPEAFRAFVQKEVVFDHPFLKPHGLMGMASLTEDNARIEEEFALLKQLFDETKTLAGPLWTELSMGMSQDYGIAVKQGSTMLRIGSQIFGSRQY